MKSREIPLPHIINLTPTARHKDFKRSRQGSHFFLAIENWNYGTPLSVVEERDLKGGRPPSGIQTAFLPSVLCGWASFGNAHAASRSLLPSREFVPFIISGSDSTASVQCTGGARAPLFTRRSF